MPERSRVRPGSVATHALLSLGALVMVFPFLWQLLTALKTLPEAVHVPTTFFPERLNWAAFKRSSPPCRTARCSATAS